MKYAVVIPDGAADQPLPDLGGRTPLQAARTPNLDRLARRGRVGRAVTTPPGFEAGSDICTMSLLGYDPSRFHTGRAPLEAAALGLTPGAKDWIFRLNLVTVGADDSGPDAGTMLDHSAGAISDEDARRLVHDLEAFWRERAPDLASGLTITFGVSYRNIVVDSSGVSHAATNTTPPHAIPGEPWRESMPAGGEGAERLAHLMELSRECLQGHAVNLARAARGQRPANMAWLWGQGTRPSMPGFEATFGVRGAMLTPVDLLAGLAALIGLDRPRVPGMTSFHDNDYAAQGRAAAECLDAYDFVCCHVEAPDEASHQGDWRTKVASIEAIDEHIIGPIVRRLEREGDPAEDPGAGGWRLLVLPDHATLVRTRKHDATPVPILLAGAWIRSVVEREFNEEAAATSDLLVDPGHDLMEYFLHGGLARVRRR